MKKKRNVLADRSELHLNVPNYLIPRDEMLRSKLGELLNTTSVAEQQKCVIWISHLLNGEGDQQQEAAKLLTFVHLQLHSNVPLKKTLRKVLSRADHARDLLKCSAVEHIKNFMAKPLDVDDKLQQKIILNGLHAFTDDAHFEMEVVASVAQEVFAFLSNSLVTLLKRRPLNVSIDKREAFNDCLHSISRLMLNLYQKFDLEADAYSLCIVRACHEIITKTAVPFETKANYGIVMATSFKFLPDEYVQGFQFKQVPALELLIFASDNLRKLGIEDFSADSTTKVIIFSAILNTVPERDLVVLKIHDREILMFMFQELISCAKRTTANSTQIIEVSRALVLLSRCLFSAITPSAMPLFEEGINFVWAHLEHNVDIVRQNTKTIFAHFLKLCSRHLRKGDDSLIKIVIDDIKKRSTRSGIYYVVLGMICEEFGCVYLLKEMGDIPAVLLENVKDSSVASQICTTYECLMQKHYGEVETEEAWLKKWVAAMLPFLKHSTNTSLPFYQRLIMSAFKISPQVFNVFQNFKNVESTNELSVLLGCLRTARKLGTMNNIDGLLLQEDCSELWQNLIPLGVLESFMYHQEDDIRIHVLALTVDCQKSTEIYTAWECKFLIKFLKYNVTTQVPNTRKAMLSLYERAITRYFEGRTVIKRNIGDLLKALQNVPDNNELMEEMKSAKHRQEYYSKFLSDLISRRLIAGVTIDSNYPRRSFCLELLLYTSGFISNDEWCAFWDKNSVQNLRNLILYESYENNKETAINLLLKFLPNDLDLDTRMKTTEYLEKCIELASDIKTNNTSAAYMFKLVLLSPHVLFSIEELGCDIVYNDPLADLFVLLLKKISNQLLECDVDVYLAAKKFAIHGILFSIRYLLEKGNLWDKQEVCESVISSLFTTCFKISSYVKPIVMNASPEGFLPVRDDTANRATDESAKSQTLLVFAWRTMREITLLIGDIMSNVFLHNKELSWIKESELNMVVDFFLELFIKTKHRGVFEQASIGFTKLCHVFWNSTNDKYRLYPKEWLQNMLTALTNAEENKGGFLSATRRSAGVPFMIMSILTTEPLTDCNKSFRYCMDVLINTAYDKSTKNIQCRQHSMNILRAIFLHNQLGEIVMPYVEDGMKIAFEGLESSNWNIRNSSTLLYGSLMMRIFGVPRTKNYEELSLKNKMAVSVFTMRYPKLYDYLLEKLITTSEEHSIFAVLLVLTRLYCTNVEGNLQEKLSQHLPYLESYLKNPVYRIRTYAAQASVIFIPNSETKKYVTKIILRLHNDSMSNNECHGLLLQLKHLIKNLPDDHSVVDVAKIIAPTFWIIKNVGTRISYLVGALYMEVVIMVTKDILRHTDSSVVFEKLFEFLLVPDDKNDCAPGVKTFNKWKLHLRIHLCSNILKYTNQTRAFIVAKEICVAMYSKDNKIVSFCLRFLNHLNSYRKPTVYENEELDKPQEYSLVDSFERDFIKSLSNELKTDLKLPLMFNVKRRDRGRLLPLSLRVLSDYPLIMLSLTVDKQRLLNFLLKLTNCGKEEQITATINCLSNFLKYSDIATFKSVNFDEMVMVLMKFASPVAADDHRLAVGDLIVKNRNLICLKNTCFSSDNLINIWKIIVFLLEDDDQVVRDLISNVCTKTKRFKITSEKAREEFLESSLKILDKEEAINFLLFWATREKLNDDIDVAHNSEVFISGDLNQYCEVHQVSDIAIRLLSENVWYLKEGDFKTQVLSVTDGLLNFFQNVTVAVSKPTRASYEVILKKIRDTLEAANAHEVDLLRKTLYDFFRCESAMDEEKKRCYSTVSRFYKPFLT